MVTKLAPLRLASLMMGAWFGFVALANYAAGFIGSFVGESVPWPSSVASHWPP
jgi:POT family proton-dependent oligopeptide transporter